FDVYDDFSLIDKGIIYSNVDKQKIIFYQELKLAIDLIQGEFNLVTSSISENNMTFLISTKYPDGLPENLALMFFNADLKYNINISECNMYEYDDKQRYFH